MTYQDTILKANYYKEYIIKTLIKNGTKLDDKLIANKLKEIDLFLSIYKESDVKTNTHFDPVKFNHDMYLIYKDLVILYSLLFKSSLEDYNKLNAFATSYVNDLLNKANACKTVVDINTSITTLGKTLAIITDKELNDSVKDSGVYRLYLNDIKTTAAKELILVVDGTNIFPEDITLKLTDSDGNIMSCTPYTLNKDVITVPGDKNAKTYSATQDTDGISSGKILMSVKDFNPNNNYTYDIYAGQNKIKIVDGVYSYSYADYINASDSIIKENGVCSFYIYDNNIDKKTSFYSSKPFSWSNFIQTDPDALNNKEFISFECQRDTIINFSTNGKVFCQKERGIILGKNLYYPVDTDLEDFYIVENKPGDSIAYSAVIEIQPRANVSQTIKYAAIKELKS